MPNVTMTLEEYEALRSLISSERESEGAKMVIDGRSPRTKKPKKPSAYNMKYSKHFKEIEHKYKTKKGSWKKDGFKKAQKMAHKLARGE